MKNSFFKARVLTVELTSLCNLRCTYCSVSHPDYRGQTSTLRESDIVNLAQQLDCKKIQLHLHGESTVRKGWAELCQSLTSQGFELSLLSNLSQNFNQFEIEVLSQLDLWVSIDTIDNELFKKMRRGSELGEVLRNLLRINAYRRKKGISHRYKWNSVLCKETLSSLPDLIQAASELGVKFISFCNLTEIKGLEGATSLWKDINQVPFVISELKKNINLLQDLKIDFEFQGLPALSEVETLNMSSLERNPILGHLRRAHPFQASQAVSYPHELKEGQTRLCLDPWSRAVIHADLGVALCERMPPFTQLNELEIRKAISCEAAENYRSGLLSESIPSACRSCSKRPAVDRSELKDALIQYQKNAC